MSMSFDLYREIILDHYKNPRNKGTLKAPDAKWRENNPLCGDVLEMQLKISKDKKLEDIKFSGDGCAISLSSASILTEMVKGKPLDEILKIDKKKLLGELGIDPGPSRIKCALLSLKVLKMAVYSYLGKEIDRETKDL
ncbi:Iron-sulfur cluster assembly scaffold protein IscU 2 [Candidatus Gugararchaeum adminiculabundum]|nr:Iron-sulfur cluster assembly scaffold protein IscU 2 [Candidatus Gugararchaeum adminiculabundum]